MTLPTKLKRLLRAFALLWGRLGAARLYVAILVGAVIALSAVGVWHIVSWAKQVASFTDNRPASATVQPTIEAKAKEAAASPRAVVPTVKSGNTVTDLSPGTPPPAATVTPARPVAGDVEREVAITDIRQTKRRGRHGETLVIATIGLASRSNMEKGDLEIRISFYDATANNELRPTDAQVTYRWLTPVRDWSDPTPKYLAATYLQWPMRHRSFERLRYGGVLVRVFDRGRLQVERSEPEGLLNLLRSSGAEEPNSDADAIASPAPSIPERNATAPNAGKLPSPSPPTEKKSSPIPALPYGKPVPGKPGFVSSPYDPKFIIDVRGFPPGTLVNDPNTGKPFRIP